jgi:hypothetical protein
MALLPELFYPFTPGNPNRDSVRIKVCMFFRRYNPASPLAEFVDHLWVYKAFQIPQLKERIFPTGTFEIVFNLQDDELRIYQAAQPEQCMKLSGAVVSGPYEGFFLTDTAEEAAVMGVHFKPGGAFPFLGASADDVADMHIDLVAVWDARPSKCANDSVKLAHMRSSFVCWRNACYHDCAAH